MSEFTPEEQYVVWRWLKAQSDLMEARLSAETNPNIAESLLAIRSYLAARRLDLLEIPAVRQIHAAEGE